MSVGEFGVAVVLADDVHEIGEAVVVDSADVGTEDGEGDGAGGIELVGEIAHGGEDIFGDVDGAHGTGELVGGGVGVLGEDVVDFVAEGVEDDGGVVSVAGDDVGEVSLPPVFECKVIIAGEFGDGPCVEEFVHDEEAEAVAGVEEFGRGGIVGSADGIDAEAFEGGESGFPGGGGDGDAESPHVGVESDAEDFDIFAIEPESGGGGIQRCGFRRGVILRRERWCFRGRGGWRDRDAGCRCPRVGGGGR